MKGLLATAMTAKTILLINNEANLGEILHLSLTDFGGWQVFSTGSLSEGLQRAVQDQPDAILLALSSPYTDYFTFLQKLRAQPETQNIPVVILTTGAKWLDSKRLQQFQAVGAIDYAADPSLLSNQITKLLNLKAPLIGDES
ncbi:two-component response regulator [Calothrix sp. NIES-4071]|nr:two-component response regulator [Calothrix sp. NIES-4071]BAZ56174.1 two-component response regulator [Calothrix sp. NIES-4105]